MNSIFPVLHYSDARDLRTVKGGFTLSELLVVMAIASIMAIGSLPALRYVSSGQSINNAAATLTGMAHDARAMAVAKQSYIWLALYEDSDKKGVWLGLVNTGKTQTVSTEGARFIQQPVFLPGVALRSRDNLTGVTFSGNPAPTTPGETPDEIATSGQDDAFPALVMKVAGQSITFDRLVVFTPRGEAITLRDSSQNPIYSRWIQVALVNQRGATSNAALLQIGGISSECATYRP
jgi:prepilin-type N-terminal cleavage/methylation domain-containing protein